MATGSVKFASRPDTRLTVLSHERFQRGETDTLKIARKYLAPISLLLISTIGVAYAATTLFTQTFPAISATAAVVTSNCTTLTPNVASVIAGSSGFVQFDCSGTSPFGTTPALTVTHAGTVTSQFTLPTGYASLFVYLTTTGPQGCTFVALQVIQLTPGGTYNPLGPGTISYCANYASAPSTGLPTFTVTWSQ